MEQDLPLRDIHLPEPISWWPPAPGWWILLIVVPTLAFLLAWLWRWLRRKTPRKLALQELESIVQGGQDAQEKVRRIAILLRRTALSVYPREEVAGLAGEAWLAFLDGPLQDKGFSAGAGRLLIEAPYRREAQADVEGLAGLCRAWIKSLPRASRQALAKRPRPTSTGGQGA